MDKIIYGGDTETVNGKPNSIQFYSEDVACNVILFVNEHTARSKFLKWCSKLQPRVLHVIYFHNLDFDLIELLWGMHEKLKENGSEFSFSAGGFDIRGIYGSPTFCTLREGSHRSIYLVDSFSFYRGSLAQAATLYCPTLPKLRRPMGLGSKRYTRASDTFVEYAMRDAQVTFHIGKAIEELHSEFDLKQCISIADMAARIFRHRFLSYTIPQPSQDVIYASLDAYHGGKNNLAAEPGWHEGVHSIDISSAYPHAMRDLPAFSNSKLYRTYRGTSKTRRVPDYGMYCVSGSVHDCQWPVLFDHSFKPLRGAFDSVWIQGLELNEALRSGELRVRKMHGYLYDSDRDNQAPGLREFVNDFYRRKQDEKDKVRRYGYKLILNSISGKFIQTRKRTLTTYVDVDNKTVSEAGELVAGGMFHPFIAAAITAHTCARRHRLEQHDRALHTATDGIFTPRKPALSGDFRVVKKATELGSLENDANGELLLIRNKCYILYSDDGTIESAAFKGKRIAKFALHGFQGRVADLERLVATGRRTYTVNRPNKLGESIKRGLTPNEFRERQMTLRVGPLAVQKARESRPRKPGAAQAQAKPKRAR